MLMYLAANTHPDIAYAAHQAARYTHDPRASNTVAIKRTDISKEPKTKEYILNLMEHKRWIVMWIHILQDFLV
jgi:hypothetical protein